MAGADNVGMSNRVDSNPLDKPAFGPEPWRKKQYVQTYVGAVLDAIAEDHGEPDAWESLHLLAAIGAISGGLFAVSAVHIDTAVMPASERTPGDWSRSAGLPTCHEIRRALTEVSYLAAVLAERKTA